ncbi:hypothetical protein GTW43_09080 [Streptomyces sp. SID5785]|uniref:hypothetical protein n=1 Tax=Streptomyces sp. SID5785 TaxID=2690309 RepID=UPI001361599F|nr:hypothetical protein [Streptomyces sp. SID5785]MZD05233.1 hypothetical protein [Streptomyces sp. SID5785]
MDEQEFMRGRVYGADHEDASPQPGRAYAELVGGPLDGLLLDVTLPPGGDLPPEVALPTELGAHGPGGRSLYAAAGPGRFRWKEDVP